MKNQRNWLVISPFILALFMYGSLENKKSLGDIYKSGIVRFVPILAIDDSSMPKDTLFESVIDVVTDNNGNVYACDYKANNIKKFDSSGKFLKTIGRQGQGPGEFNNPSKIVVSNDRLIVLDSGNGRFCALSLDGEFIKSAPISIGEIPRNIRALTNGDIAVEVEKLYYKEPDKPQEYLIEIYSLDLEKKKTVYSQEIWRYKLKMKEDRPVQVPQPFSPRIYWDISPTGKLVIGYSKKYEIEIYDIDKGKISSFAHSYEPIKVTDKDKEKFFAGMGIVSGGVYKQGADDFTIKNTEFPRFKPAFQQIKVDSEGNILVMCYRNNIDEEAKFFDAFDSQGNFIRNVQIIGKGAFPYYPVIRDSSFWQQEVNKEGFTKIVKYRISE